MEVSDKYKAIIHHRYEDAVEIVDAAVALVLRLDELSYRWAHHFIEARTEEGLFRDHVFG